MAGLLPEAVRFVTVRRGDRLTALLPYTLSHDLTGLGGRVARPFLSPFVTASAPLVADGPGLDRDAAALVDGLEAASGGRAWRWPLLPTRDGAVPEIARRHARARLGDRHGGGVRAPGHGSPRRSRRLPGGSSESVAVQGSAPPRPPARGGRRGRPCLRDRGRRPRRVGRGVPRPRTRGLEGRGRHRHGLPPETATLARALFADAPARSRARADALTLDGRPIAISLALVAGGTATLLKTAYDEDLRSHAPRPAAGGGDRARPATRPPSPTGWIRRRSKARPSKPLPRAHADGRTRRPAPRVAPLIPGAAPGLARFEQRGACRRQESAAAALPRSRIDGVATPRRTTAARKPGSPVGPTMPAPALAALDPQRLDLIVDAVAGPGAVGTAGDLAGRGRRAGLGEAGLGPVGRSPTDLLVARRVLAGEAGHVAGALRDEPARRRDRAGPRG